jgi:hypothetical protein
MRCQGLGPPQPRLLQSRWDSVIPSTVEGEGRSWPRSRGIFTARQEIPRSQSTRDDGSRLSRYLAAPVVGIAHQLCVLGQAYGRWPRNEISLWRRAVPGGEMAKLESDLFVYKANSVLSGNLFDTAAIQAMVIFFLKAPNVLCASSISRARPHSVGQHLFARKWANRHGCWTGWYRCSGFGRGGVGCGHRSVLAGLARCG